MPPRFATTSLWYLVAALAALVVVQGAWAAWARGAPSRASRRRLERAARGESAALSLVARVGFSVLAVQPEFRWCISVDGRAADVVLRPDLLLEHQGLTFVADVKTGGSAPDPLFAATRRQLLEYYIACGADGALVVDVEAGVVRRLDFGLATTARPRVAWRVFALGTVVGAIATAAAVTMSGVLTP